MRRHRQPESMCSTLALLVGLYEQKRITLERRYIPWPNDARGTLKPEWIQSAARVVAEIRRKGEN